MNSSKFQPKKNNIQQYYDASKSAGYYERKSDQEIGNRWFESKIVKKQGEDLLNEFKQEFPVYLSQLPGTSQHAVAHIMSLVDQDVKKKSPEGYLSSTSLSNAIRP